MSFEETYEYIKNRFNGAKFSVSCFETIEEVDSKCLSTRDEIIYMDEYYISVKKQGSRKWEEHIFYDYFIIKKKEGQECIRYCDVIDTLIENNFERLCDHRYLESIGLVDQDCRNQSSIPVYGSFWGS